MTRQDLNTKRWYRLLKVLFVISFLVTQLLGFALVSLEAQREERQVVEKNTPLLTWAGDEIKRIFPEYSDIQSDVLAERFAPGSFDYIMRFKTQAEDRGASSSKIREIEDAIKSSIQYVDKDVYTTAEKLGFYLLSFFSIILLFWLIARLFFYIVLGEKFFSKPFARP